MLGGHKNPPPLGSTHAGVVNRESFRTDFDRAAFNRLEAFAYDIRNAYLQDPSSEKNYAMYGV